MATGLEYREESIKDVPDDQFQRGLIFGTEAVSAQASRDNWSAFVEFSIPVLESLELNLAARYDDYSDFGDTTNPKVSARWEPLEGLAFRASWGTGFRAPSLAQIGLGPSRGVAVLQGHVLLHRAGHRPELDRLPGARLHDQSSPATRTWRPRSRRTSTSASPGSPATCGRCLGRLLGHQAGEEDRRGAVRLPVPATSAACRTARSACATRAAARRDARRAASRSTRDVHQHRRADDQRRRRRACTSAATCSGGELYVGLDYSRMLEFKKVELNADGTRLIERDLTGEYEYPEDRFVVDRRLGHGRLGRARDGQLHRLVRGRAGRRRRRRARLRHQRHARRSTRSRR